MKISFLCTILKHTDQNRRQQQFNDTRSLPKVVATTVKKWTVARLKQPPQDLDTEDMEGSYMGLHSHT